MDDLAIGIDLGTTNSCVCVYLNGKTKILENSDGGRITPSFIYFTSLQETIVGEHARGMADGTPSHGVYEVKRLVGRKFNDSYLQKNLQYLSFVVEADSEGDPVVVIEDENEKLRKTPEELCTIILQKLKKDSEEKMGQNIRKAVITVPAYFNVTQREVTLNAARKAGFTVLKLLNEPTAAALAYYFEQNSSEINYSLVYDLGGGTFDVSILKRTANNIEIIAVDGDTQLGGHDFDNAIVNFISERLLKDYEYDPRSDKSVLMRLHKKCERAKRELSTAHKTMINLIGFVKGHHRVQIILSRAELENLICPLLTKSIDIVESCLKTSNVSKSLIGDVILSGGSTRIPKIQQMLSDSFGGKQLNKFVSPDECVAEGAALQAAILSKSDKQLIPKMQLIDVIPLSIGVCILGDEMSFIIKKNSTIPATGVSSTATVYNNQHSIKYVIYEGERSDARKNRLLGKLVLTDLTPAPPGKCSVTLTLHVDENGILHATAEEKHKDNKRTLEINYTKGNQNDKEIKNSLLDAQMCRQHDEQFVNFVRYKRYLILYCESIKYNLEKLGLEDKQRLIYTLCHETRKMAGLMEMDEEERLKALIREVEEQCKPLVSYYKFDLMPNYSEYI